jgi:hypothetical protein
VPSYCTFSVSSTLVLVDSRLYHTDAMDNANGTNGTENTNGTDTNGVYPTRISRSMSRTLPFLTDILGYSLNDRLLFAVPKSMPPITFPKRKANSFPRGPSPPSLSRPPLRLRHPIPPPLAPRHRPRKEPPSSPSLPPRSRHSHLRGRGPRRPRHNRPRPGCRA